MSASKHFLRVSAETKQRQREAVWCQGAMHCFGWRFSLTGCPIPRVKIAMDGNFRHIAPWRALYADPTGFHPLPSLFRKSVIQNTASPPGTIPPPSAASSHPSPFPPLLRKQIHPIPLINRIIFILIYFYSVFHYGKITIQHTCLFCSCQ